MRKENVSSKVSTWEMSQSLWWKKALQESRKDHSSHTWQTPKRTAFSQWYVPFWINCMNSAIFSHETEITETDMKLSQDAETLNVTFSFHLLYEHTLWSTSLIWQEESLWGPGKLLHLGTSLRAKGGQHNITELVQTLYLNITISPFFYYQLGQLKHNERTVIGSTAPNAPWVLFQV